jgi:hypothetical protein
MAQAPSRLYQQYRALWRRIVLSGGWALLYFVVDAGVARLVGAAGAAMPIQWRLVLAVCILISGLWMPAIAYVVFIVVVAYPLYLVSIYVMALGLAVLILIAPLVMRHMPLALMVVWAPVLAPIHLTPVVPLLIGLWASDSIVGTWYRPAATVSAALCALWLKLAAGMSGDSVDLWHINGWSISVSRIYERFHAANSLRTIAMLGAPLARLPGEHVSMNLLANLLQVLVWGAAAYVVASIREVLIVRKHGPAGRGGAWTSLLSLTPGVLALWAGYVAVPTWLQVPGPRWLDPLWLPAQLVLAGSVALGLDGLLRYLHQPVYARPRAMRVSVPHQRPWWQKKRRRARLQNEAPPQTEASRAHVQEQGGMPERRVDVEDQPSPAQDRRSHEKGNDIIMIELD